MHLYVTGLAFPPVTFAQQRQLVALCNHHFHTLFIEQASLVARPRQRPIQWLPSSNPWMRIRTGKPVSARATGRDSPTACKAATSGQNGDAIEVGLHPSKRVGAEDMLVPLAQAIDQLIELLPRWRWDPAPPWVHRATADAARWQCLGQPSRWRIPSRWFSPDAPPHGWSSNLVQQLHHLLGGRTPQTGKWRGSPPRELWIKGYVFPADKLS